MGPWETFQTDQRFGAKGKVRRKDRTKKVEVAEEGVKLCQMMNQVKDLDEEQRCAKSRKKSGEKFVPDGKWRKRRCQKRERKNGG